MTAQAAYMECPKCGNKLKYVITVSMASGLLASCNSTPYSEGYQCSNCSKWIEPEFQPVMKYDKNQDRQYAKKHSVQFTKARKIQIDVCKIEVQGKISEIRGLRTKRMPWVKIKQELFPNISLDKMRACVKQIAGDL